MFFFVWNIKRNESFHLNYLPCCKESNRPSLSPSPSPHHKNTKNKKCNWGLRGSNTRPSDNEKTNSPRPGKWLYKFSITEVIKWLQSDALPAELKPQYM